MRSLRKSKARSRTSEERGSGHAASVVRTQSEMQKVRAEVKETMQRSNPKLETKDSDYVFITFILNYLPHGIIGLLMAVIFCAATSSTAAELNALGSTTRGRLLSATHPAACEATGII